MSALTVSDLQAFAAHCRAMSTAKHKPTGCPLPASARYYDHTCTRGCTHPNRCTGCVTDSDRDWWTRLADEADAFLAREPEPDLFGASA